MTGLEEYANVNSVRSVVEASAYLTVAWELLDAARVRLFDTDATAEARLMGDKVSGLGCTIESVCINLLRQEVELERVRVPDVLAEDGYNVWGTCAFAGAANTALHSLIKCVLTHRGASPRELVELGEYLARLEAAEDVVRELRHDAERVHNEAVGEGL